MLPVDTGETVFVIHLLSSVVMGLLICWLLQSLLPVVLPVYLSALSYIPPAHG